MFITSYGLSSFVIRSAVITMNKSLSYILKIVKLIQFLYVTHTSSSTN